MSDQEFNFSESMKQINEINDWFQGEDLDLEEALTKLKQGKELITKCKERLSDIENEFKELRVDFAEEEAEVDEDASSNEANRAGESENTDEDVSDNLPF